MLSRATARGRRRRGAAQRCAADRRRPRCCPAARKHGQDPQEAAHRGPQTVARGRCSISRTPRRVSLHRTPGAACDLRDASASARAAGAERRASSRWIGHRGAPLDVRDVHPAPRGYHDRTQVKQRMIAVRRRTPKMRCRCAAGPRRDRTPLAAQCEQNADAEDEHPGQRDRHAAEGQRDIRRARTVPSRSMP